MRRRGAHERLDVPKMLIARKRSHRRGREAAANVRKRDVRRSVRGNGLVCEMPTFVRGVNILKARVKGPASHVVSR